MNNYQILIEKYYQEAVKGIKEEWFYDISIPNWYSYVVNLPQKPKITYLIIVFNNQVFNGGFHQYFINGYGQFAIETIEALLEIGAFESSNLLQKAYSLVNSNNNSDLEFRDNLLNKKIEDLFSKDVLNKPLEELDDMYYDKKEDIENLLGMFLSK